jgi:phosphoribosylanthranilate isomerase
MTAANGPPARPLPVATRTAPAAGALWVKVCGLRSVADVEAAAQAGADAVGFVFHPASPRHLELDAARELARAVPAGVASVAVFLHPSRARVAAVLEAIAPDWVQCDLADVATLSLPAGQRVLPVLRAVDAGGAAVASAPVSPAGDAPPRRCLFEGARSGAGERADWSQAAQLARRAEVVLAGGLDAANVADALRAVRPYGVDVSSGVERERGVKDAARIREFVRAARAAAAALSSEERTP